MQKQAGGLRGARVGLMAAIAAVLVLGVVAVAPANNLDAQTAFSFARSVAKHDCQNTRGCTDYGVRRLHKVSQHKAAGKIFVSGSRNDNGGFNFVCVRQIVVTLDHVTGDLDYGVSRRRCQTS